jgi:hypothetical protein
MFSMLHGGTMKGRPMAAAGGGLIFNHGASDFSPIPGKKNLVQDRMLLS